MKRILVFICVSVMFLWGFMLNASPQVSRSDAASYDINGVWRLYWDDYCINNYYFDGEYFRFIGSSTSGTWEYYWGFEGYKDEYGLIYQVNGSVLTLYEYGYAILTGTFQSKNTIVGYVYIYDEVYCFRMDRVINDQSPFGNFELPANGDTVSGSIPISGWTLDDTMVTSIKIYYSEVSGAAAKDPANWRLIEDNVTCLYGARPDVASKYWDNYYSDFAGWGYMCLTYFLPNRGNGSFMLHVVAEDIAGNSTTWSITVKGNNANRVKPFGAIDTPGQCGIAEGYASEDYTYRNWGWALTPWPNSIESNSIGVFVDGVRLGNATYDLYRSDIANFFPGYDNTYGAGGYFDIYLGNYQDLSQHTLYWFATDSAGNKDGIGSRYFYVWLWDDTWSVASAKKNFASIIEKKKSTEKKTYSRNQFADIPMIQAQSISLKRGFDEDKKYSRVFSDQTGMNRIKIRTGEPIEIKISDNKDLEINGYTILNKDTLGPLPVGSTLDKKNNTFYWIPGPGFMGKYECLFIEKGKNGEMAKRIIIFEVNPGYQNHE